MLSTASELWIVNDNDLFTNRLCDVLETIGVRRADFHILDVQTIDESIRTAPTNPKSVIVAAEHLCDIHLDTLRRLRQVIATPLAVVTQRSDQAAVIKAVRAGATDFIDVEHDVEQELRDFLARCHSEMSRSDSAARLTTVIPCYATNDGDLLSANLATSIAHEAGQCCLLDFHMRGGELAMYFQASPNHTLYDLATQTEGVDAAMLEQAMIAHESGVRLLSGVPMFCDLSRVSPNVCRSIVELARATYPHVLANVESVFHAEQIHALTTSDDLILAMRLEVVSLRRAKQLVDFLERHDIDRKDVQIAAMATGSAGELSLHSVSDVLGVTRLHRIPDDSFATTASLNFGVPMVSEFPKSKASIAIRELGRAVSKSKDASKSSAQTWSLSQRIRTVLAEKLSAITD